MNLDLAQQFFIKEICLRQAVDLFNKAADTTETIIDTAKKFEAFFYTDPEADIGKQKHDTS